MLLVADHTFTVSVVHNVEQRVRETQLMSRRPVVLTTTSTQLCSSSEIGSPFVTEQSISINSIQYLTDDNDDSVVPCFYNIAVADEEIISTLPDRVKFTLQSVSLTCQCGQRINPV